MKFSVLLLYPDYIASNFGQETYFSHRDAPTSSIAVENAQKDLANFHGNDAQPDDFFPLLVLHGWHDDVRP